MSLLDTIRFMARELALVITFISACMGVAMISHALNFDPIWPVIVLFFGFLVLIGGK